MYSFVRTVQATHRRGCILPHVKLIIFNAMGEQTPCVPSREQEAHHSAISRVLVFSVQAFPPRGRSENHCEDGGDFKQLEEGRGGETCSGGWGRRTLGLRRFAQEHGCEVKPWTRDEPAPIPSRSLPPTPAKAGSHTHPWGDLGCQG